MSASEWDIQVLRDLGISAADEFASLDAKTANRVLAQWRGQSQDAALLVFRLRAALRSQEAGRATSMLEQQRLHGEGLVARLAGAMPEMVLDGQPHPAAILALNRGITTPGRVRAFVRAWIVEHEQQPGAAYELPDSAYWWSVVNREQGAAAA